MCGLFTSTVGCTITLLFRAKTLYQHNRQFIPKVRLRNFPDTPCNLPSALNTWWTLVLAVNWTIPANPWQKIPRQPPVSLHYTVQLLFPQCLVYLSKRSPVINYSFGTIGHLPASSQNPDYHCAHLTWTQGIKLLVLSNELLLSPFLASPYYSKMKENEVKYNGIIIRLWFLQYRNINNDDKHKMAEMAVCTELRNRLRLRQNAQNKGNKGQNFDS